MKHPCDINEEHVGQTKRVGPYWLCLDCSLDFIAWVMDRRRRG